MVTILSIDGGGIRGLLPAKVLQEIRFRLEKRGELRTYSELFNLVAGTSTGSLIALAVSLRNKDGSECFPSKTIVDLYKSRSAEIFPLSYRSALHTAVQAFRNKYSAEPFEKLLLDFFGDKKLSDAETNLLITSFDTNSMQPHCMKNRMPKEKWTDDPDYLMRDVARASAAAPAYFSPAFISSVESPQMKYSLIDGGVFASNPAGLAYVEATKIFPDEKEFLILSLGTGKSCHGYSFEEIHSWGYVEWVNPKKGFPIGAIMSAGQSEAVNHQLSRLDNVRFIRINTILHEKSISIDDAGKDHISTLLKTADLMINSNDELIEEACEILSQSH